MIGLLEAIAELSVLAFVVGSMLAAGMSQSPADVIAPLKRALPVTLVLLVNFAFAPLLALGMTRLIPLQPAHATGLLLLGAAAGAPFLPKLAEISGDNVAHSVAAMVLLMASTVVFMPLVLPLIVPGLEADPLGIAVPLLVLILLPLAIGFALARIHARWVGRLLAVVRTASSAAFVLLVVLLVGLNVGKLADAVGTFALGTYALFVFIMMGAGYMLGSTKKSTRRVLALAASQRNIPAALVVAGTSFDDPGVTVMVLVAALVGLVLLVIVARLARRATSVPAAPEEIR